MDKDSVKPLTLEHAPALVIGGPGAFEVQVGEGERLVLFMKGNGAVLLPELEPSSYMMDLTTLPGMEPRYPCLIAAFPALVAVAVAAFPVGEVNAMLAAVVQAHRESLN